jgi:hypothetical protein
MDARGTAGAKGSDIFCRREVGCCIVCRGKVGSCVLAGDPGVRAALEEDEARADAESGRARAGELTPGRGKRVAGDAICRVAARAGEAPGRIDEGAAGDAFARAGVAELCSKRDTGPALVVAIAAFRLASMSLEPSGIDSTTASSALEPPCVCRRLISQLCRHLELDITYAMTLRAALRVPTSETHLTRVSKKPRSSLVRSTEPRLR